MKKIIIYFKSSIDEIIRKVTWPKFSSLQSSAFLVLVASLIFAVFTRVIDMVFEYGLNIFYKEF